MAITISLNYMWMIILTFLMAFSCELQPIFAADKSATDKAAASSQANQTSDSNKKLEKDNPAAGEWLGEVKSIVKKYNSDSGIVMKVTKTVHMELLGEEKESNGEILFKKGQINMTLTKPEFSQIIMNEKNVWVVQKQPKEFGGKLLVTIVNKPSINKKTKAPLVFLMSDPTVWDQFQLIASEKKKHLLNLALEPKDRTRMPDVVHLKLQLDTKTKKIAALSLTDELDNKTVYKFTEVAFNQKIKNSKFNYNPPADAEVTSY